MAFVLIFGSGGADSPVPTLGYHMGPSGDWSRRGSFCYHFGRGSKIYRKKGGATSAAEGPHFSVNYFVFVGTPSI